jgi:hypothetical protein
VFCCVEEERVVRGEGPGMDDDVVEEEEFGFGLVMEVRQKDM